MGGFVDDALCVVVVVVEVLVVLTDSMDFVACFIPHCFKPEISLSLRRLQTNMAIFLQFPRREDLVKTLDQ